jgi:hypothetical protein
MLSGLAGRFGRPENGRAEPCPECGWDGDWSKIEYVIDWVDADGPTKPYEFCGTCGCQLIYTAHETSDDTLNLTVRR